MSVDLEPLATRFRQHAPAVAGWSLRLVEQTTQHASVRQDICEPPSSLRSLGAMITIQDGGGCGYAATSDVTLSGLLAAAARAASWARWSSGRLVAAPLDLRPLSGAYRSPVREPWSSGHLDEALAILMRACARLKRGPAIVDRTAALTITSQTSLLTSSAGGESLQSLSWAVPYLVATANRQSQSITRTSGRENGQQGGIELLRALELEERPERCADEALQLLDAPDCPARTMDLILMPSQMVLQIHESIGHPLELDRILGDERNYAGTSFVTPEMFGTYRYGSPLLNVTFDPHCVGEFASYSHDDDGTPAERVHLIRDGILMRGLGGALSQQRSGLPGTANARASSWNRPPIDRMANINLEPGGSTLTDLIESTERGILMDTNRSWSIDDSRNKFQFGCEYARLIEDGEVGQLVKNPNYRGISATFWRNLTGVADQSELGGANNCGKGEPNQVMFVGHASPACRFTAVDVFGGG